MKCNWMWVLVALVAGWFAAQYYGKVKQGHDAGQLIDNAGNIAEGLGGILQKFKRK